MNDFVAGSWTLICVKILNILWGRTLWVWTSSIIQCRISASNTSWIWEGKILCVCSLSHPRVDMTQFCLGTSDIHRHITTNTWQWCKNVCFTIFVTSALYFGLIYNHFNPIHIKFNSSSFIQMPSFHCCLDLTGNSLYTCLSVRNLTCISFVICKGINTDCNWFSSFLKPFLFRLWFSVCFMHTVSAEADEFDLLIWGWNEWK